MAGVLTIYECPVPGCNGAASKPEAIPHSHGAHIEANAGPEAREVHVFREEDVRPLWEALHHAAWIIGRRWMRCALDAFPAPEEWR